MAVIENLHTGQKLILNCYHTIGRSKANHLSIPEADISKMHATIEYENGRWFLKDQSRNGTKIGKVVINNVQQSLEEGAIIQFGGSKSTVWKLIDISAPCSYLKLLTDKFEFIALKNGASYLVTEGTKVNFYRVQNTSWFLSNGHHLEHLLHGKTIQLGEKKWVFVENEPLTETYNDRNTSSSIYLENSCNLN